MLARTGARRLLHNQSLGLTAACSLRFCTRTTRPSSPLCRSPSSLTKSVMWDIERSYSDYTRSIMPPSSNVYYSSENSSQPNTESRTASLRKSPINNSPSSSLGHCKEDVQSKDTTNSKLILYIASIASATVTAMAQDDEDKCKEHHSFDEAVTEHQQGQRQIALNMRGILAASTLQRPQPVPPSLRSTSSSHSVARRPIYQLLGRPVLDYD